MCCLNVSLSFALLFIWANPYSENEEWSWVQILSLPFIIILLPILLILDLVFLPFNLIILCFQKYCVRPIENENIRSEIFYNTL